MPQGDSEQVHVNDVSLNSSNDEQKTDADEKSTQSVMSKEELSALLKDAVAKIHEDTTNAELVEKLKQELHLAKNQFLVAMKAIEDSIAKLTQGKNND